MTRAQVWTRCVYRHAGMCFSLVGLGEGLLWTGASLRLGWVSIVGSLSLCQVLHRAWDQGSHIMLCPCGVLGMPRGGGPLGLTGGRCTGRGPGCPGGEHGIHRGPQGLLCLPW